jgi:signal transduction histidine kinase
MAGRALDMARRGWRQLAVPCGLLVLVAGLAALQYRWVGQIADGERQRMQASVQARAGQFAEELDREATTVFTSFSQLARPGDEEVDYATLFAHEYARWVATSAHARLIRALFLVQDEADGSTSVRRLSGAAFEPVAWPSELSAVRARFHDMAGDKVRLLTLQFDGQIPALLIPVARLRVTDVAAAPRRVRIMNFAGVSGCLVVELDRDYLRREWLPALARRYFDSSQGFDYNLAVVDSASRSFVYVSDPRLAMGVFAKPDAKVPLFQVRPDQVNRLYIGRAMGKAARAGESLQMSIATLQGHVTTAGREATAPQWQLLLTHRAGSLEAAITQSRHRNLAISFGILALLAASLGLIVLSSRRAASLARQQVEFVAGVSHELRTPLSVICSAAENLADGVVVDGAQVRRYGELIAAEGRRLAGMVEQVMTFAGLHAGRELAERETVNVDDVIDKALEANAPAIEQGHVTLERHIAADLPPVRVNAGALRRALQNLIDNAIKYGGDSKWIRVTADLESAADRRIAITVEDHGIGIPLDEQRRLFEPFFRGRDVAASPLHGSGLGLSLVKRIVDADDGTVTVRSTPGRGSAFTIHLPAADRQREITTTIGASERMG